MMGDVLASPREGKLGRKHGAQPTMRQTIKQELADRNVKLRTAFVHLDPTLQKNCAQYMVAPTLKAGGLDLSKDQLKEAQKQYMSGEGRFLWEAFCDDVEKSRKLQHSQAALLRTATMFQEIDADGSGRLDHDELHAAVNKLNIKTDEKSIKNIVQACDTDGDGNISYQEFVDGMAKDMVSSTSVWTGVRSNVRTGPAMSGRGATPRGPPTPRGYRR